MRIKKISPTTPANGNIENQYGTSQTNAYSEEYANTTFASKDVENYSTTEKRVGTWINGKPLYRQTFGFNVSNLGTETYFNWTDSLYNTNSISNVDEIINVKSFYKRSDDTFQPVPTVNRELNYYGSGVFDFSGTGFRFYVGTLFNTFTINYLIVTIEYTKTTD
jgi:hypothetical protein